MYWYNLKKSGETDSRTLHAGCPVLVGYKWGMHRVDGIMSSTKFRGWFNFGDFGGSG